MAKTFFYFFCILGRENGFNPHTPPGFLNLGVATTTGNHPLWVAINPLLMISYVMLWHLFMWLSPSAVRYNIRLSLCTICFVFSSFTKLYGLAILLYGNKSNKLTDLSLNPNDIRLIHQKIASVLLRFSRTVAPAAGAKWGTLAKVWNRPSSIHPQRQQHYGENLVSKGK